MTLTRKWEKLSRVVRQINVGDISTEPGSKGNTKRSDKQAFTHVGFLYIEFQENCPLYVFLYPCSESSFK